MTAPGCEALRQLIEWAETDLNTGNRDIQYVLEELLDSLEDLARYEESK